MSISPGRLSAQALIAAALWLAVRAWAFMLLVSLVHSVWLPHLHTVGYLASLGFVALVSLAFDRVRSS